MANFTGHSTSEKRAMRTGFDQQAPGMFRGTNYISGKQLEEERKVEQEIKLQELKNKGLTDVANITGLSVTEQQRLRNIGSRDVANITGSFRTQEQKLRNLGLSDVANIQQAGQTERDKLANINTFNIAKLNSAESARQADLENKLGVAKLDFLKEQEPFRQYSTLQELENNAAEVGRLNQYPLDMGYREYQRRLANPEMASTEDSIRKKMSLGTKLTFNDFSDTEKDYISKNMPGVFQEKQTNDKVTYNPKTQTYTNASTRTIPFILNQVETPVYGPNYRGTSNPLGKANNSTPISATPIQDIFGEFTPSVNPRYR